jgi:putative ABC transport system substrate-binding protein
MGPHLQLFRRLVPRGRTIGLIYNPTEAESLALARAERKAAAEMGLQTVSATVRDSSEVLAAAESLVGRVEAISVLRDSTVVSALESVVKVCTDHQIPLLAGDADSVQRGAVAAWTFDYKEHGRQAGRLAVRVLRGAAPSDLGVELTEALSLAINERAAAAMGVTLPPDLRARAAQIY